MTRHCSTPHAPSPPQFTSMDNLTPAGIYVYILFDIAKAYLCDEGEREREKVKRKS